MTGRRRQAVKVSDVRALANRMLAGSDEDLAGVRQGICAVYEHLSMAANDYHGYNNLPGTVDSQWRRWYYGDMTPGDDADAASAAAKRYRDAQTVVARATAALGI